MLFFENLIFFLTKYGFRTKKFRPQQKLQACKQKNFRSDIAPRFGFTPFYGIQGGRDKSGQNLRIQEKSTEQ